VARRPDRLSLTELWYRLKKLYAIYPGVVRPISGSFLADHYARRRRARGVARAMFDAIVGTGFLAWVPLRARMVQRRYKLDSAWRKQAIGIARTCFADPNDIALFRIAEAAELNGYIRRFEDAGINKLINPMAWTDGCVLADKIRFYERCVLHALPHPHVVATIEGGEVRLLAPVAGRPLLLKPARGEGGRGVRFVDAPIADDAAALADWLKRECGGSRGAWLVQTRITPHADLRDLALNALPTARITTILDPADRPEVVSAVLRLPSDPAVAVDNMKAGGLLSSIDLDAGTLSIACKGYGGGDYPTHPVTGATITNRIVPDWEAAKALVAEAHRRAFGDYALIGWDVGFSPNGPLLIEGNGKPGVLMPQRAGRRGLGGQRYGELLRLQLARHMTG
jgi:hypothetical protein